MKGTSFTDRTVLAEGKLPFGRSPDFWARALSELMDLLAFAAIYVTGEVKPWPFLVAGGLSALRLLTRFRLRAVVVVIGFLIQLFVGAQLVLRFQLPPIIAAAHAAPIAMAWIALARGSENYWGWRMGLGFIGLILASALTPDFSVMLFILIFVISGSIGLACRFLAGEFVRRGVSGSLPRGFIRSGFYQSGILLFSALLIFPLIPRVQGRGGGSGSDVSKTGYTEEVGLGEWTRVTGQGSSAPALRIYGPNGTDPSALIPAGLLRSRVLNVLAGNHWNPASPKSDPSRVYGERGESSTLMIVREMIGPANLPIPYSTRDVAVELYGYRWGAERTKLGEWREGRSRNQRFTYYATIDSEMKRAPQDTPTVIDLGVPENFRSERMRKLADRLFQGRRTADSKISAIQSFYIREKFTAATAEDERGPDDAEARKLPPIERFLFVERAGHCELFASGMAILLRMGGVPARLVAGFRVSRNSIGDVLTIRQSDAHAWVEAYIPGHGWTAIDPTPRLMQTLALTDWLRDSYDWASAKWTQYIVNYGEGENSIRAQWEKVKKISSQIARGKNPFQAGDTDANLYLFAVIFVVGSVTLSLAAIAVFRRLRRPPPTFALDRVRRELARERAKMDRLQTRLLTRPTAAVAVEGRIREWFAQYERARFGGDSTSRRKDEVTAVRRQRVAIEKAVRETVHKL